jgi:hypothetical protein
MTDDEIDLLAMKHLGIHGVTKKSLREALSLYSQAEPKNPRGRPPRDIAQMMIFHIYYQATEVDGLSESEVTNKKIEAIANSARAQAHRDLEANGASREILNDFKYGIPESSVKNWRRDFKAMREADPERFHQIHKLIEAKRQK